MSLGENILATAVALLALFDLVLFARAMPAAPPSPAAVRAFEAGQ